MLKRLILAIGLGVMLLPGMAAALDIPAADFVVDNAQVLSVGQEEDIRSAIYAEQDRSGSQIAVLTIASLEGESLEEYSINVAREWGVGLKDFDNGVLLLVAVEDRRLRIEVGRGLEGAITDAESGRIIDRDITPEFRDGNYSAGILAGVAGISAAIAEDYNPAALEPTLSVGSGIINAIFFGFFGLQWFSAIFARSKSWWAGGVVGTVIGALVGLFEAINPLISIPVLSSLGLGLDYLVSRNYAIRKSSGRKPAWWAGGAGRSGSSRGSGRSFGGGGFSGGGASGGW